jgi:hypothetical protein
MEKKQTAVEWFIEQLDKLEYEYDVEGISILEFDKRKIEIENQARQMEKEQIIEAHGVKTFQGCKQGVDFWTQKGGEQYYKETYGQSSKQ